MFQNKQNVLLVKISRYILTERSDTVHGVSNAEVLTQKHYLLRLRFHTKTGQEKILQILKKLDIAPATTK